MYRYLLGLTIIAVCHYADGQANPDVRRVVWEMTKEEVRNTENLEELDIDIPGLMAEMVNDPNKDVSFLVYRTPVLGLDAFLFYAFVSDKLRLMSYLFIETHSGFNLYASDFENVNGSLYDKYGRWKSDVDNTTELQRKTGIASDMGFLLQLGGYRRIVEWQTPRTVIRHQINSDGGSVMHALMYENLESYKAREKAAQDDI